MHTENTPQEQSVGKSTLSLMLGLGLVIVAAVWLSEQKTAKRMHASGKRAYSSAKRVIKSR